MAYISLHEFLEQSQTTSPPSEGKDFNAWNEQKILLENTERNISFHEREVWWCSLGLNIGDEQDGKNDFFERPVLVIKKFNNKLAWVVPMSTQEKIGSYYHSLEHDGINFVVILSQLRLVSTKRFLRFIRKISPYHFLLIQNKIVRLLKNES